MESPGAGGRKAAGMGEYASYSGLGVAGRDRTRALFGQTMGYVAVTTGFFAFGAYLGRNLSQGWAILWFIVAFVCLISMNFTVRRSAGLTMFDFQRLRRSKGLDSAPMIAASIVLDARNVFLFFLRIFSRSD